MTRLPPLAQPTTFRIPLCSAAAFSLCQLVHGDAATHAGLPESPASVSLDMMPLFCFPAPRSAEKPSVL